MVTLQEAKESISYRYANSFTRMAIVIDMRRAMKHEDWLLLLGESWTTCDDIFRWVGTLRDLLGEEGPIQGLMTPGEYERWTELPDALTVYRGAGHRNRRGICWSLDKEVAASFPFLNRYRTSDPAVYVGQVRKANVLAYKADRGEGEIISFKVRLSGMLLPSPR